LYFALGQSLSGVWVAERGNKAMADEMVQYLQLAFISNSPDKFEIGMDLLRLWDELGQATAAHQTALKILQIMPPYYRGKIGLVSEKQKNNLFQKYLVNAKELTPIRQHWQLVE
jgi:hypothetical protein